MAEAHAAVAFSFSVTQEGLNVHISHDALKGVYLSGIRSWRKRFVRFLNRFASGVFPAKFWSLGLLTLILLSGALLGYDVTCGFNAKIHDAFFTSQSFLTWMCSYTITCTLIWLAGVLLIRYLLKLLLSYHGFMFEPHGKISMSTKLWAVCTKILGGSNPQLYSYQASLPRLPVPAIKDTINRYLRSVRPLLCDADYDQMVKLSDEFSVTMASRLQRYLVLKSWWATNYVSDWWEQYVYLAGRGPIMVNSNYYGMDLLYHQPTSKQTSRAASFVHALFAFRSTLDKENIKPIKVNGVVPLCSAQYERIFNTCRLPGVDNDTLHHWMDARHIAVLHQGRWFKVMCYKNGQLLGPKELEEVFETILNNKSAPSPGEENLAALTAGDRIPWAQARNQHFSNGVNKKSLHAIEKSAFVVVLDDEEHNLSEEDCTGLSNYGRSLLHGNCNNRWFDKSFNIVFFANGRLGLNAEHSWADAPIMSHVVEQALGFEYMHLSYDSDGKVSGVATVRPVPPQRLAWSISDECQEVINTSLALARNLADDVHLNVRAFKHFGKGLVKTFKMSPDAFIQAALQLAHLRDKGHFALTYEASMTRLFREGRTETVRSCTSEMVAFARSMEDPNSTDEERHTLLRKAADFHVSQYKEAMIGKGVDRHLFCLYVVSKYLKLESPFLQKVLSEVWELSTSQTPTDQSNYLKVIQNDFFSAGGGFGPVADDGYGVSYIICHENLIMFHISSKSSSSETNSDRFGDNIERAMLDMKDLCEKMKGKAKR
ncbi:carnitine O-palmitoyltransferase 1, liver isoform-like isoform X2 [Clavelina lepadiformis]|uniref:carnitine O-palmitoyltransferase 1, liver isoform-like isoform X2 n=1 Tax=Clavelina lepadiformis TaxID=159417 RepID=UPI0040429E55